MYSITKIQNEKSIMIKKQRQIIQTAYQKSQINAQYKFFKTQLIASNCTLNSQCLSIQSKTSHLYNLHQQNTKFHSSIPSTTTFSIFKQPSFFLNTENICRKNNFYSEKQSQQSSSNIKHKFLSLIPRKLDSYFQSKQIYPRKSSGINLTKRSQTFSCRNNKQGFKTSNLQQTIFHSNQKIASTCFGRECCDKSQEQLHEAVFSTKPFAFSKQIFQENAVKTLSNKLAANQIVTESQKSNLSKSKQKQVQKKAKLQ